MKIDNRANIDEELLDKLNRYGLEELRSRSQIIEMALESFLRDRGKSEDELVTSDGSFVGHFSRELAPPMG
jgi:metal-responsive CopG/Arc/MetJ family transcriptional regulator